MQNQEVLNKVGELIGQAVGLIEDNPKVLKVESLDVSFLSELLSEVVYKIETRSED